jgi:hypothetical protein
MRTIVMMEALWEVSKCLRILAEDVAYSDANDSRAKAWILDCRFIWVFHRIKAGTTTSAISVRIVDTVAVCAMMRNTSGAAQVPLAVPKIR